MRAYLLPGLLLLALLSCTDDTAGTATDVNSGSLSGVLKHDETPYAEKMDVYIRNSNDKNIVNHMEATDGTYSFDSLPHGKYDVIASINDNSVTLGIQKELYVQENSEADISISRIVTKGFQLYGLTGGDLSVESVNIENYDSQISEKSTVHLTFGETDDAIQFMIPYSLNGVKDSVQAEMVRLPSLAYSVNFPQRNSTLGIINLETTILTGSGSDSSTIIIDGTIE